MTHDGSVGNSIVLEATFLLVSSKSWDVSHTFIYLTQVRLVVQFNLGIFLTTWRIFNVHPPQCMDVLVFHRDKKNGCHGQDWTPSLGSAAKHLSH